MHYALQNQNKIVSVKILKCYSKLLPHNMSVTETNKCYRHI